MHSAYQIKQHLSYRVLRYVLAIALLLGIVFSALQVIMDARLVTTAQQSDTRRLVHVVQDTATQAIYSLDTGLAEQIFSGLFASKSVFFASIQGADGRVLAQKERPLTAVPMRELTDQIFGEKYEVNVELKRNGRLYGHLNVQFDTAEISRIWLNRTLITFAASVVFALLLALALFIVVHVLLTRPLLRIVHAVQQVNPASPDENLLSVPQSHSKDELGLWITATNDMLKAIATNQTENQRAEDRIVRLSNYDQLTGLPTRDSFIAELTRDIADCKKKGTLLGVYVCGVDDFHSVNEQLGFPVGDQVLSTLANRLRSNCAGSRFNIARLGGDRFVISERGLQSGFQAADTADFLLFTLSQPIVVNSRSVIITVSGGISLYPNDANTADRLLQSAEQTLALAKQSGHNCFKFYVASVGKAIRDRRQLAKDLARARSSGQLHMVYQPQVNLKTHQIIGAEALLRWQHPILGPVSPDQFIEIAETNGSIADIGQWVLDESVQQAAKWAKEGIKIRMAVNLSPVQLSQPTIVDSILQTLARHNLPPSSLELEITETSFMANINDAVSKLEALRRAGISIAVDDFGTGYSSLTYLKRMPVQYLKIDKQFIADLLLNEEDTQITNIIIDLGKSLKMSVIAEGVETAEQEAYLGERGCHIGQGFYFSKPLNSGDFEVFFRTFNATAVAGSH